MLRATSLVLLVASVAYGQKCCYPDKWEGVEGFLSGSADDEGHGAITNGNVQIAMDATMEAVYIDEHIDVGGMHKEYKVLQLFAQNSQYIIVDNKCTRTVVGQWGPSQHCIPDNATMLRSYYLGNKVPLHVTEYQLNENQETIEVGVTDDCVPAVEKLYGNIEGTNIFTVTGFFNLTAGIKNPSIFNIPDICKQAPLVSPGDMPEIYRRRRRSIFSMQ